MPTPSLLRGESLLNKFNELDQYDFEKGKIPLIYEPSEENNVVPHQDFFEVLNKQIASIDSNLEPINYKAPMVQTKDMKEHPEFQQYRMVLTNIASESVDFQSLTPTHQKRIIDYNALQATALHNVVKDRMPDDLNEKDRKEIYKTYNRYFEQNYLPAINQTIKDYSRVHSIDASNDNLKTAFANTLASAIEGVGTLLEPTGVIEGKWLEEKADKVRDWTKDYRQGTGMFALSEEEVKREYGDGWDAGFMTTGTFKNGYALSKVMEGIVQQGVQGVAPFAGGIVGGAIGGPLGAVTGVGIGLGAGATIEAGSFEDEMRESYTSLREQALLARKMVESGTMTNAEFVSRYSIDIGEQMEGENIMITADVLSDKKIEEITENLARSYAGFSTMVEGAGTVLSLAGGPVISKGLSKLTSRFIASKVGQKAVANRIFNTIKKPLVPVPAVIGEVIQEGTVEGMQEDMNMTLMQPYMADYNRLTEEQQQERIKSARFLGGVLGGGMRVGAQVGSKVTDGIESLKNKASDMNLKEAILGEYDINRVLNGDVSSEITEARKKNKLYVHENGFQTDLAVQVALSIDPLMGNYRETIKGLSGDPQRTDEFIAVRQKFSSELLKSLPDLLIEAKKKGILSNLDLTASDFKDRISPQALKKVFGREAQKVIKQRANAFDVTDDLLAQEYDSNNEYDYKDHVSKQKLGDLVNKYNKLTTIKKPTLKQQKLKKSLEAQIKSLRKVNQTRADIRNIPNDEGVKKSLSKNDPTVINSLKPANELVFIDKNIKEYLKADRSQFNLRVGNKTLKKNPKTGKKEIAYIANPVFHTQMQPGAKKANLNFKEVTVFESDISTALTKEKNEKGNFRWSPPQKSKATPKAKPKLKSSFSAGKDLKIDPNKGFSKPVKTEIEKAKNYNGKQLTQKLKEAGVKGRSNLTTVDQKREAYIDYLIKEATSVSKFENQPILNIKKLSKKAKEAIEVVSKLKNTNVGMYGSVEFQDIGLDTKKDFEPIYNELLEAGLINKSDNYYISLKFPYQELKDFIVNEKNPTALVSKQSRKLRGLPDLTKEEEAIHDYLVQTKTLPSKLNKFTFGAPKEFDKSNQKTLDYIRSITSTASSIGSVGGNKNTFPHENIAKNNKLGKFLTDAISKLNVKFEYDSEQTVSGKYNSKTNTITLRSQEDTKENHKTIQHEIVHALTSQTLKDFDNGKLSKKDPRYSSVVSLNKLFKKVQKALGKDEKESIKKLEKFIKDYKQGVELTDTELFEAQQLREEFYAFTNSREFVAELMTNPSFQDRLKKFKIPNKQTSLFEKFKELIANVLGFKKQDTALYQGALNIVDIISESVEPQTKRKTKPILIASKDSQSLLENLQALNQKDSDVNFLSENTEAMAVQNVIDDLVNEDFIVDEDADVNFLVRWGRTKGILSKQDKNRVYRAFEHLWISLYTKYDLPETYFTHWEDNVNKFLEGTPIKKHFKEWSKNYRVDILNQPDRVGMFAKENEESVFNSTLTGDASFDEILADVKSAYEYTEEFIRQGIGVNEEGRLEADTKSNNFAKIDMGFFKEIELNPTSQQEEILKKVIQEEDDINGFIEQVSDDKWIQQNKLYLKNGLNLRELLSLDTKGVIERALTRYFVSNKRTNRTPTGRGAKQKDAVKTYYGLFKGGKGADGQQIKAPSFDLKIKDKSRIFFTGQKEPQVLYKNVPDKMRTRAVERNFNPKDLFYISLDDFWGFAPPSEVVGENGQVQKVWNNGLRNLKSNKTHYKALIKSAIKQRMVPLLVRGDGNLIPMVKITSEHIRLASGKNAMSYWSQELATVPDGVNPSTNRPYQEEVVENWINGYLSNSAPNIQSNASEEYTGLKGHRADSYFNASNIARHEAYKEIYGDDYWIHLTSHKLLHRAKIPFGVGNSNPNMPNRKLVQFDPKTNLGEQSKSKVVHTFNNGMTSEINLVQKLDKQYQYIWDGQTITSEKVHAKDYVKYHGTNPKGRRAKTFFYHRGETGVVAQKHQEMSWYMQDNAVKSEIYDGDGDLVATIKKDLDGYINIQDKNGDYIDYLSTPDETKITTGEFAGVFNEPIELDGSSINLIMYPRENDKSHGKIFKQLFNYFPDEKMQRLIRKLHADNDPRKKFSPVQLFNRLLKLVKNPIDMDIYKLEYSRATIDGIPLPMARNALVNVGFHPSESGTNANIVKNGVMKEINDFKNYGTKLDFRMDNTGTIEDDQIVMPYDHKVSNNIRKIMQNKEADKDKINDWLSKNDVYVLVTRSPVPSRFGYRMMKIKSLENIGDTFITNPRVVKEVFEADGDGDTASIVFIEPKHRDLIQELINRQEIPEGLNLSPSEEQALDVSTYDGLADAMHQMSVGKNAVGEVGNVARNIGIIKSWFNSLEFVHPDGKTRATIKMRNLSDEVYDPDMDEVKSIEEFVRIYMQAGADHAKLLKLQDWNYEQQKLYRMMFYYKEDPDTFIDENDYKTLKDYLFKPITEAHSVIAGKTFENDLDFTEFIEKSQSYMEYVEQRKNLDIFDSAGNLYAKLQGKGHPTHLIEDMILGFGHHANINNYDGDVFKTDNATAMMLHTQTIKEFADQWGEDQINLLLEEDGIDTKKLTTEQKRNDFRSYIKKGKEILGDAQKFYYELANALNKKPLAEKVDDEIKTRADSSNKFVFDKRASEIYEKWTSLLEARGYTPAMRKIFTQAFLSDVGDLSKRGSSVEKNRLYMPPTDPKNPNSLLDPSIMKDYYKRYNEKRLNKDFDNKIVPLTNIIENLKNNFQKLGCIV